MIKVLALFGKSGSGKDTIQNTILGHSTDFHKIISCTTRPMREGEKDGEDYHFISEATFTAKMYKEQFIEALAFNGWFYGALITALDPDKINIGIFTPEGIESLLQTASGYDLDVLPVFVDCPDKVRLLRALNREENPDISEICRRYFADETDFAHVDYDYITINNGFDRIDWEDIIVSIVHYCEDFFD